MSFWIRASARTREKLEKAPTFTPLRRPIDNRISYCAFMPHTVCMKLLPKEERRWFVAAVVLVLVGCAILLLPFETIPVLGDA